MALPEELPGKDKFEAAGLTTVETISALNGDYSSVPGIGDATANKVRAYLLLNVPEPKEETADETATTTESGEATPTAETTEPEVTPTTETTESNEQETTEEEVKEEPQGSVPDDVPTLEPSVETGPGDNQDLHETPEQTGEDESGEVPQEQGIQLEDKKVAKPAVVSKGSSMSPERYKGLHRGGNTRTR